MPYKNKEDRAEAVRRYRARMKERQAQLQAAKEILDDIRQFLTERFGFDSIPFEEFIEICQEDLAIEEEGIRIKPTGGLVRKPEPDVILADEIFIV